MTCHSPQEVVPAQQWTAPPELDELTGEAQQGLAPLIVRGRPMHVAELIVMAIPIVIAVMCDSNLVT